MQVARAWRSRPRTSITTAASAWSRRAGNKKAFGIDRAANSWADLPEAELILIAGSNVSECFPRSRTIIWQARRGARLIVVDPASRPSAAPLTCTWRFGWH